MSGGTQSQTVFDGFAEISHGKNAHFWLQVIAVQSL